MCRGSRHIFIGKCPSVNWSGDSLLPSRRFNPLYAVPPPSSEGGEGATAPPHRFNYCDKVHKIALPFQNVCARRTHLNILPQRGKIYHTRKARISPPQSGDFTRQLAAVFHCKAGTARFAYAATACSAAARFDVNTPSFIATALREALPPAKPARSTVALPPTAFTAEEE